MSTQENVLEHRDKHHARPVHQQTTRPHAVGELRASGRVPHEPHVDIRTTEEPEPDRRERPRRRPSQAGRVNDQ